jgi:hypothetical protein
MSMTTDRLIQELEASPVKAVETPHFQEICCANPAFFLDWPMEQRWRLLYALDISLLDYRGALPLDLVWMETPESLGKISWRQVCQTLFCDDFILEDYNWSDELETPRPLTAAETQACEGLLKGVQCSNSLNQLLEQAITFVVKAEDYFLENNDREASTEGRSLGSRAMSFFSTLLR